MKRSQPDRREDVFPMDKPGVCVLHRVIRDRKITVGGWKPCILSARSRVGRSNITARGGGTPGFIIHGPEAITRPPDQRVSQPPLFESA